VSTSIEGFDRVGYVADWLARGVRKEIVIVGRSECEPTVQIILILLQTESLSEGFLPLTIGEIESLESEPAVAVGSA